MSLSQRTTKSVVKGREYPLGATVVDGGVNFALYSRNASAVYLLLFDEPNSEPTDIIRLHDRDKFIWHAEVPGIKAGQLYGYKVQGDYRPEWGLRFNDAKLMFDPYAKAVTGKFKNTDNLLLAYEAHPGGGEFVKDTTKFPERRFSLLSVAFT
jgi:isoamylase